MTNSIEEIIQADVIVMIGTNTTEAHPIIAHSIKRAVEQTRAKLVVVDPRHIDLVNQANYWLRLRPGTDIAWLNGAMHWIIENNLHDKKFIEERCEGFDKLAALVKNYTPERVEQITGIAPADLKAVAELIARAKNATFLYCLGITEHTTGVDNVMSISNLAMLTGNLGRPSTGVNPLRGQNNVQGACDMGCLPNVFPGYQPVNNPEIGKKFAAAWGADSLPDKPGLTMTDLFPAATRGEVRGVYIMGEDPMVTDANTAHIEKALRSLEFLVVQDIFLTPTAKLAHVVLPASSWAEKDGTFTNTERRIQRVRAAIPSVGDSLPDWQIVQEIARRMGVRMNFSTSQEVWDEMRSLTPSYHGIAYSRLGKRGIQWPCPSLDHPGTQFLHAGGFPRGKGILTPIEYKPPIEGVDQEYPFTLMTGRMQYHYHGSMTRRSQPLNLLAPEALLEISLEDASKLGISDREMVAVSSRRGRIEIRADVTKKLAPGMLYTTFHFAETPVNRLTNDAMDPVARTPEFKKCAVRIEKLPV